MRLSISLFVIFLAGFNTLHASEVNVPDEKMLVQEARVLIKGYAGQLKSALVQSMKIDGAAAAIDVCARLSPEIAFALGEGSPWTIGRTSLKARNSASEPDEWEHSIMETFLQRQKNGEKLAAIDHYEMTEKNTVFRYMKAIPTGNLCLTCHGDNVAPDIKKRIADYYPDDMATGFKVDDMRGAFTLQKILSE